MSSNKLNDYIEANYKMFLDYANFHAEKNGLSGMGEEILQFVFEIVLVDMDRARIMKLLNSRYGNYNELHTYILGMIKINAFSPRSDFRRKVLGKHQGATEVEISKVEVGDNAKKLKKSDPSRMLKNVPFEEYDPEELDHSGDTFRKMNIVREKLESLEISELERDCFKWKFFYGNQISEWQGSEPKSKLYKAYNRVVDLLRSAISPDLQLS